MSLSPHFYEVDQVALWWRSNCKCHLCHCLKLYLFHILLLTVDGCHLTNVECCTHYTLLCWQTLRPTLTLLIYCFLSTLLSWTSSTFVAIRTTSCSRLWIQLKIPFPSMKPLTIESSINGNTLTHKPRTKDNLRLDPISGSYLIKFKSVICIILWWRRDLLRLRPD